MLSHFRTYLVGISILLTSTIALAGVLGNTASAVVDNDPDCDNVAIIRCGVFSESAMREKASQKDVPRVFNALGVSQEDLKGKFVNGIVWRDGRVTVGDKTVATGAMTAGRNFGGTPIPNTNNAGIYPTSKFVTEGQTAFVKMKADGTFDFAVIKACGNPVKATPKEKPPKEETPTPTPTPTPKVDCVSLTAERITNTNRYTFTARATASGGAKVEKYEFGFGDGKGITVAENVYTYEYLQPGHYKASVVVHFKAGDKTLKAGGPACEYPISVVAPQVVEPEKCPYNTTLPKDSPDCKKPIEYCPLKGKETLPKDSAECEEDEEPAPVAAPAAIPDTGAGALISGVMGTSFLSYGAYTYLQSRRNLIDKFLGR